MIDSGKESLHPTIPNNALESPAPTSKRRKLPVTLLSGFLVLLPTSLYSSNIQKTNIMAHN